MARQPFGGLTFERPSGWKEKAVLAYDVAGLSFGECASRLEISTEPRDPSDTLIGHARRQGGRLARELRTEKVDVTSILVGEQAGVRLRIESDGDRGPVVLTRAYLANPLTINEVLVFTLVAGEQGPAPTAAVVFDTLLASIRITPDDAMPMPTLMPTPRPTPTPTPMPTAMPTLMPRPTPIPVSAPMQSGEYAVEEEEPATVPRPLLRLRAG
jgi:hypothetical protein